MNERERRERAELRSEMRLASTAARGAGWRIAVAIIIGVLFFGALGIGTWYFKTQTSEIKGAGDAKAQVNSAANRLQAQTRYTQLYEGIQASDKKITVMATNARSEFDRTNVQGAVNLCLETVAEYNRLATDVTTAKWRPELYPERVGSDPATDCQPNLPTPTASR